MDFSELQYGELTVGKHTPCTADKLASQPVCPVHEAKAGVPTAQIRTMSSIDVGASTRSTN